MYLLIDCDNFFVSCEKAFQPRLKNRPVVVLSNNDGCVVSRSYEAKALGIPMCAPYFKIEKMFKAAGGIALSSNYELYADMSKRVMRLIESYFGKIEIYSIDEAFTEVDDRENLQHMTLMIRNAVMKQTGISVSVGAAATKTLCKIAGEIAKKQTAGKICILTEPGDIAAALQKLDVGNVWGIGRKLVKKLNFMGIFTAAELAAAPRALIRRSFGILTEKTQQELNGISCIELEDAKLQKSILCSRSFETEINSFENLKKIISEFVNSACLRLREQNGLARGIVVFIATNRFREQRYSNSRLVSLKEATCHTAKFTKAMIEGLKNIYRPEFYYKRAGIMLTEIESADTPQKDFLVSETERAKDTKLMKAVDAVNRKLGRKTLYFGTQDAGVRHYIKREFKSASYTTSWNDLPLVH